MILFSVLIVLLLIILAFVVFTGIRIIPQNMVGMVSVLGKYQRQIQPGLHVVMPFITRVDRVDLAQVPLRLSEQSVISRDTLKLLFHCH